MSDNKSNRVQQKTHRFIRWIVLGSVLVFSTFLGLAHQYSFFGWTPPGVDALCPFGGLEAAWSIISSGGYLPKIAASSVILLVGILLTMIISRRSFCGQYCPLGTLQEIAGKLGRKVLKKRWVMPAWLDKYARYLKYVILLGVLILTWTLSDLVLRPFDPWVAYHHLTSSELFTGFAVGFGILILSLAGSFFYERFFCKYLCPMGAAIGPLAHFSPLKLERNEVSCIDCKACDKVCPMNIPVSQLKRVNSSECIDCGLCVHACPVKDTLEYTAPKGKKISAIWITFLGAGIMILTTLGGTAAGWFNWSILSLEEAQKEAHTTEVETKVSFDPGLIKGRDTFQDISRLSGVHGAKFKTVLGIAEEDLPKAVKDVVAKYGTFTTDAVRALVAEELGLPPPAAEGH